MPSVSEDALRLLRTAVGDPHAMFREGQLEAIINLVEERRRLLVVQRTGWGKSAVYFISAKLFRDRGAGPTLIISPLISLMRNQLLAAKRMGIKAVTINSSNYSQGAAIKDQILTGKVDALLISPERLANQRFVNEILLPISARIGMLVVDEAHCISDWGHDFRPDYRRIVSILKRMPGNLPVLGTTATANQRVIDDLKIQLGDLEIHRGSLVRTSLMLDALHINDPAERLAWLAHFVPKLPGSGIIYTLTTRDAERVALWLQQNGITARAYHAGIKASEEKDTNTLRAQLEEDLLHGRLKVLVATAALGMGYDKPDLGFVIHYQAPASIIAYYQQVGRAGRAIDKAYGILLLGDEDKDIHTYFQHNAFPDQHHLELILGLLERSDGLTQWQIEQAINLRSGQIERALKHLSMEDPAPVVEEGFNWKRTAIAYVKDSERIERLNLQRSVEWAQIQAYSGSPECYMTYLQNALDDPGQEPCGHCANCLGKHFKHGMSTDVIAQAEEFLRHGEFDLQCPGRIPTGALTHMSENGFFLPQLRPKVGRILSRWGHTGWGKLVMDQKHAGRFGDELVNALADMIQQRWQPNPAPEWVTCVPSLKHPDLVPDLAQRLALKLELKFQGVVTKQKDNAPQKSMQNRYHQATNLDGAFAVKTPVPTGPVLLIDDVVDSGWTMAIITGQLRMAGCTLVYPVALASTSHS